ncbi:MAG: DUF4153 domain-containing protein [Bacteroidota bacterium]
MIPKYYRLLMVVLLTIIYNAFFWQKVLGINVFIFSLLMLGSLLALNPSSRNSRNVWITGLGTILTGLMVILHNSPFSKVVHIGSLILFAGFVHQPSMRSVILALLEIVRSYFHMIRDAYYAISESLSKKKAIGKLWEVFRASFIPLSIIIAFLTVFTFANPRFDSLMDKLLLLSTSFFQGLEPGRLLFFFFGGLLILGLLYRTKEASSTDDIQTFIPSERAFDPSTAKKAYFTWSVILSVANLLLFLYLLIEVVWILGDFKGPEEMSLRTIAFKGLYLFIFIIIPSLLIFMYQLYRRKHLIRLSGRLRQLAIVWLVQTCFLLLAVQVRILRYIAASGLTYRRIFLLLMLTLVLTGVCVLLIMMLQRKGYYFFIRSSSWAAYALMVLLCLFSWDRNIAQFNLTLSAHHPIDGLYLTQLEDHVLPVLLEKTHLAFEDSEATRAYLDALEGKMLTFRSEYENSSWLCWNIADQRTHLYLTRQGYNTLQEVIQFRKRNPKTWEGRTTSLNKSYRSFK